MMLMRRQKEKMSEIKIQIDQLQAQHDRLQKERDQLQERMNHLEEQREHLQMQTDQAFRSADEIEKICDEIWHHANTIHLYSSLAEEESKSITMKEKQKEIIRNSNSDIKTLIKELADNGKKLELEDIATNKKIGDYGAEVVPKGATILTHCNAGALATVGYGTALGLSLIHI